MSVLSCFFPTTVVLVDDNAVFTETLRETLNMSTVTFRTFTSPIEALEFINDTSSVNRLDFSEVTKIGEESTSDWKSILLNINHLHGEIYSYDRFAKISTIVTDYAMCSSNGIELCNAVDDKNIQKILLTGIADERIAIDAFNDGFINGFITKGTQQFEIKVRESIEKAIHKYFSFHTDSLSQYLTIQEKTHLKDPIFANFFFKICSSKRFIEYYMLDNFGSYLFLDERGNQSFLSVLTENELCRIIDIGAESGEISASVLDGLKTKEYMLAYHNRRGALPPIAEWEKYLVPACKLCGYQTYYFSMVDRNLLDLDFKKIKSFENYKRSLNF